MSRSHSHGGIPCPHPTKKACEAARRIELGQCSEMIPDRNEPRPCSKWAVERFNERGYCGQHLNSVVLRTDEARRIAEKKAAAEGRIDAAIAWHALHPSIHDRMPKGAAGA